MGSPELGIPDLSFAILRSIQDFVSVNPIFHTASAALADPPPLIISSFLWLPLPLVGMIMTRILQEDLLALLL